ncbi:MAG: hypothetical protein IKI64_00345 [Clostridia bacterium]|nr:hypothetical protein [Clostridia bacterium]
MKKLISFFLAIIFAACFAVSGTAFAIHSRASKTIAIVFDNSGSMFGSLANPITDWCRATYAVEVFASMIDTGDEIRIFPMNPVKVRNNDHDYNNPIIITDPSNAGIVREIQSLDFIAGTPIESIEAAKRDLSKLSGEKWLVVITDGNYFHKDGSALSEADTKTQLEAVLNSVPNGTNAMFLKVGSGSAVPNIGEGNSYIASDSRDILERLTSMCNRIFGRDELPRANFNGPKVSFDVSMKKLIIFAQGENISNITLSGGKKIGNDINTKFAEYGGIQQYSYADDPSTPDYSAYVGKPFGVPDTSLQGTISTYGELASGEYDLSYSGNASSVAIYYEPDVDLIATIVDAEGNEISSGEDLLPGDYSIVYGLYDSRTGKKTDSSLLGKTDYKVSYTLNGEEKSVESSSSGSIPVHLDAGDTFDAEFDVTYLENYRIHKTGSDFGWPQFGFTIPNLPGLPFEIRISGGQQAYRLSELNKGEPFIAEFFRDNEKLNGDALDNIELTVEDANGTVFRIEQNGDRFLITPDYADPSHPEKTQCGTVVMNAYAVLTEPNHDPVSAEASVTFEIENDVFGLKADIELPAQRITISELPGKPIIIELRMSGNLLTKTEMDALEYTVTITDNGKAIHCDVEKDYDASGLIVTMSNEGVSKGDYSVIVDATTRNSLGEETRSTDKELLKVRLLPTWLILAIIGAALAAVAALLWFILSRKMLPKSITVVRHTPTSITINGRPVNGDLQVGYNSKGRKTTMLSITSPINSIGQNAGVTFNITIGVKATTTRFEILKARLLHKGNVTVRCESVTPSTQIFNGMIGGAMFKGMPPYTPDPCQGDVRLAGGQLMTLSATCNRRALNMILDVIIKP